MKFAAVALGLAMILCAAFFVFRTLPNDLNRNLLNREQYTSFRQFFLFVMVIGLAFFLFGVFMTRGGG
jgi:hypothetical protein